MVQFRLNANAVTRNMTLGRWIFVCFAVCSCSGAQVSVRDEKKFAMLFQSVDLQCQYSSKSSQTPVVQWWYKSYCRDRSRDSFSLLGDVSAQDLVPADSSHLDCSDSSRTVRIVASGHGSSMTLAEHYRGRDISIINKADLRIGALQWGDSGVYVCKVIIADDPEGKNEAEVELLVLGKTSALDDLLPEIDVEIMPEWLFVGVVIVGSLAFLLLVGVCWCQCCPHSCCCYLRCCCCPETCCCPRHLYEAGKAAKMAPHSHIAMYPPYYVPSMPTMVSSPPPSLVNPNTSAVPSVANNVTGARSMSELSSLHEGDSDFRQSYRQVQRTALPPIADGHDTPELWVASSSQGCRPTRQPCHGNQAKEQLQSRWNPRSEHLQRKTFSTCGRTGSLDELEDFALSYDQRGRWGERECGMELQERERYRPFRHDPRFYRDEGQAESDLYRKDPDRDWDRRGNQQSPPPSPRKRRNTGDSERYAPPRASGGRDYDDALLSCLLERKAWGRGRLDREDGLHSDTPSKEGSRKSSDCPHSRSPSNRPEEEDGLPPYSEISAELSARPFSYTRPVQGLSHTLQERRDDREKPRKASTLLSRDSLIV